jgi:hypothetical protein
MIESKNMEVITIIITLIIFIICIILGLYATSNGLDLNSRTSWFVVIVSPFFGFLLGFGLVSLTGGAINKQIDAGVGMSFIYSFAILLQGLIMRHHLKNSKKRDDKIKYLFLQLKKREGKNFFARLAEKILEKII